MDSEASGGEGGAENGRVRLTRRALLVGVGVAIGGGGSELFVQVAKAAAGDGPLEAGRISTDQLRLTPVTSNPSPSNGYAALAFREDRL